jgi:hypothetical protein
MPYIKQEDRKKFDDVLKNLPVPANAGELNYLFTKIAINYFKFKEPPNQNYQTINDIAGAFYGAAADLLEGLPKVMRMIKSQITGMFIKER